MQSCRWLGDFRVLLSLPRSTNCTLPLPSRGLFSASIGPTFWCVSSPLVGPSLLGVLGCALPQFNPLGPTHLFLFLVLYQWLLAAMGLNPFAQKSHHTWQILVLPKSYGHQSAPSFCLTNGRICLWKITYLLINISPLSMPYTFQPFFPKG